MSKIEKKLQEAQSPDFWGQIQIDYQAGKAVVVRKIETRIGDRRSGGDSVNRDSGRDGQAGAEGAAATTAAGCEEGTGRAAAR